MLAYILALAVGFGSFSLYMAAFFFPEVHRKYDLVWSGVGMFYALVLWVCAGRITGGVLLGQMASVALLGWFGWQTLKLRQAQTPIAQQTQIPGSMTLGEWVQDRAQYLKASLQQRQFNHEFDALLKRGVAIWETMKGWLDALISTTFPPEHPSAWNPPKPSDVTKPHVSGSTRPVSATDISKIAETVASPESDAVPKPVKPSKSPIQSEPIAAPLEKQTTIADVLSPKDKVPEKQSVTAEGIPGVSPATTELPSEVAPASPLAEARSPRRPSRLEQLTESLANLKQRIQERFSGSSQPSQANGTEALDLLKQSGDRPFPSPQANSETFEAKLQPSILEQREESDAAAFSATREDELDAEWDDLEETYPEFDTVESDISHLPTAYPFQPMQNGRKVPYPPNSAPESHSAATSEMSASEQIISKGDGLLFKEEFIEEASIEITVTETVIEVGTIQPSDSAMPDTSIAPPPKPADSPSAPSAEAIAEHEEHRE